MPKYYFHAHGPIDRVPDIHGADLPDHEAALAEAERLISEIRNGSIVPEHWEGWSVEIVDELGTPIATACFEPH
jgi:hypothetical protein